MKHFFDKVGTMSKQVLDTAIIIDSNGKPYGKIIVRYTDSDIGWNNETGIIFHYCDLNIDFSNNVKNSTYGQDGVFKILRSFNIKHIYGWNKREFYTYGEKIKTENKQNIDSISRMSEVLSFKVKNKQFKILWC